MIKDIIMRENEPLAIAHILARVTSVQGTARRRNSTPSAKAKTSPL
jgi:hypothetical protein